MLDKLTVKLLKSLEQICGDGNFKVIETADMAKTISKRTDAESIQPILKLLRDNEMIDVKYSDDKVHCISVLPKGRVQQEVSRRGKRGSTFNRYKWIILVAVCFAAAFLGAFIGGLIC